MSHICLYFAAAEHHRTFASSPAHFSVHVRYVLSPVRLSVVCLSVTLVHPTQAVVIFGNISTAFGTLAIR